jgi:hypothetical protein
MQLATLLLTLSGCALTVSEAVLLLLVGPGKMARD